MSWLNNIYPLIIGKGEGGTALFDLIKSKYYRADWLDIQERKVNDNPDIIHIMFPCDNVDDFIYKCVGYINKFKPKLTIIDSTVGVGFTRLVYYASNQICNMVHSPVVGNTKDGINKGLLTYTKYIGPIDNISGNYANEYYKSIGLKTRIFDNPETTELAKLWETTVYGILISVAQEMKLQSLDCSANFEQMQEFLKSIESDSEKILGEGKKHYKPMMRAGYIGGHCVIPNIKLLLRKFDSTLVKGVLDSNERMKKDLEKKNK